MYQFSYLWPFFRSTAVLLTVVSYIVARVFNRQRATWAIALNISKDFDRVWHAGLLHKLKSSGVSCQVLSLFCLLSDIGGVGWVWLGSLIKKVILTLVFLKTSFLLLHFSYNTLIIFLMVFFVILIYGNNATLFSKLNRAYLWKHLELASKIGSDLGDTVEFGRKWVVHVSVGKSQLVSFDG